MKSVLFRFGTVASIRRLPGSWQPADYRRVLEILDVDDVDNYDESDLEEMSLMALQDRDEEEAMLTILSNFTEGRFTKGQVQNLCEELKEDRAWEEYADLAHQRALYVCVDLLNGAFPFVYPRPSATRVRLAIEAEGLDEALSRHPLGAATLLRGVGRCQERGNILNRFFADQIAGAAFPEADWVVWHMETARPRSNVLNVDCWGSSYWFEDIEEDVDRSCTLEWARD